MEIICHRIRSEITTEEIVNKVKEQIADKKKAMDMLTPEQCKAEVKSLDFLSGKILLLNDLDLLSSDDFCDMFDTIFSLLRKCC